MTLLHEMCGFCGADIIGAEDEIVRTLDQTPVCEHQCQAYHDFVNATEETS